MNPLGVIPEMKEFLKALKLVGASQTGSWRVWEAINAGSGIVAKKEVFGPGSGNLGSGAP